MIVLGVDPGETTGLAKLEFEIGQKPYLCDASNLSTPIFHPFYARARRIEATIREAEPDLVIVEDYRIYQGYAQMHTGVNLFVHELVVLFEAMSYVVNRDIECVRLAASKKGRWPDARLKAKGFWLSIFDRFEHPKDATQLALAYLEKEEGYAP